MPGSQLFTKMNESLAKLYSECLLDDLMALSIEEGSGVHEKLGIRCMRQALGPGALGRPGGRGWRGSWQGGSGWGRHVNSRPFHFNV